LAAGDAEAAFKAGLKVLDPGADSPMPGVKDWVSMLDSALAKLDRLKSREKEILVRALAEIVLQDGQLAPTELELLRVTCDMIHVPLPLLTVPQHISRQA
jgi:hypothetical protein